MTVLRPDSLASGLDGFASEEVLPLTPAPAMNWRYRLRGPLEMNLGRAAAACVHPNAAWRLLPAPWRWWILIAYAGLAYAATLAALLLR